MSTVLKDFGFIECGDAFYFPKLQLELYLEDDYILSMEIDGIEETTVVDWINLNHLPVDKTLLTNLTLWIEAQRNVKAPGILQVDVEDDQNQYTKLEVLPVTTDRKLVIYTRGKALMKSKPRDSQCSFNAAVLDCRGGGVDLRKMNGLHPEVQKRLLSCYSLPRWLKMFVEKVETNNYTCVDVFCTKGRHRSVAVAELLKQYYPNAVVSHLTIK